jgi:hypothetical protein
MQAIASTRCTVLAARPAVLCQARRASGLRAARLVVRAEQVSSLPPRARVVSRPLHHTRPLKHHTNPP